MEAGARSGCAQHARRIVRVGQSRRPTHTGAGPAAPTENDRAELASKLQRGWIGQGGRHGSCSLKRYIGTKLSTLPALQLWSICSDKDEDTSPTRRG